MTEPLPYPIIFFDGQCNLCNGSIKWIARRDRHGVFHYVHLQSDIARRLINGTHTDLYESVILAESQDKLYTYSTAALRICRYLPWPARVFSAGLIIPKMIRDSLYKWIARNRYRWFGKESECLVPSAELQARFLG